MIRVMVIVLERKNCFEGLKLGETPLLAAVKNNDEIMMKFLLDLGAHPDLTDFKV